MKGGWRFNFFNKTGKELLPWGYFTRMTKPMVTFVSGNSNKVAEVRMILEEVANVTSVALDRIFIKEGLIE